MQANSSRQAPEKMNTASEIAKTTIVEVNTAELLREFVRFPLELYHDDPHYVAPLISERLEFLDPKRNPFFSGARVKLFLARKNSRAVGRISTCVHFAHNEIHHENTGFFGFFDTIDDSEVASALLKVALITLKQEGMTVMRGPISFSLNHECGFLVEGFDSPPAVMMTYNRPYQPRFAEEFGLKKVMDLLAYMLRRTTDLPERVLRLTDKLATRAKVVVRPVNMKNFAADLALVNQVYNQAWVKNWGFVPMSSEEFAFAAKHMKEIIDPELALLALVDGKPVGFSLTLPDINLALKYLNGKLFPIGIFKLLWHTKVRNKLLGLRTITMGVIPEYQKRGIDTLMYVRTYQVGKARGYQWSEISWVLETNTLMRSLATSIGCEQYKTYRLLEMPI